MADDATADMANLAVDEGEAKKTTVEIGGKSYGFLADGEYDAIVLSTGFKEWILAGLMASEGLRVLQIDRNAYYGGACASLSLEELYSHFGKGASGRTYDKATCDAQLGRSRSFCVDLVPKFLMANGKLVKMLLKTGVTRYIDFNGVAGSYVLNSGKIYRVPVTPKEALTTSLVGFFQKRYLRSFAEFMRDYKPPPGEATAKRVNALNVEDYKKALISYYAVHNPAKTEANVDDLMAQTKGRRMDLIEALERKYGVPVLPQHVEVTFGPGPLGLRIDTVKMGDGPIATAVAVVGFSSDSSPAISGGVTVGDIIAKVGAVDVLGKSDEEVKGEIVNQPRPLVITFMKASELRTPIKKGAIDLNKISMRDLYKKYGLDENSQNFIGHAMALRTDDGYLDERASATVEAIKLYGSSVGLYGQNSPYLYPLYGLSSLPEGFSRLAAIHGGAIMLRTDVDEILMEGGKAAGVRVGETAASAKIIVGDPSYFDASKSKQVGSVIRSICILKHPIARTSGGDSAQIILPAKHLQGKRHDVYISSMAYQHQVTPQNVYIAICSTTVETNNPIGELSQAFALLGEIVERFDAVTPLIEPLSDGKADGCYLTSSLDATSHFESAAVNLMDMYETIFGKPVDLTVLPSQDGEQ